MPVEMGTISLDGMHFFASHGVLPEERSEGNDFTVDLKVEADTDRASKSDDIGDTVDYRQLYDIVKEEMDKPSALLEHIAGRIIRRIGTEVGGVLAVSVTVTKMNPPLGGDVTSSSVTLKTSFTV